MKIYLDNEQVFELSETKKKVIKNDIPAEEFDDDIKRRLEWVIIHKYEACLKRLKDEWLPKLKNLGVSSIPLDDEVFAQLVFDRPEYKDRSSREAEKDKKPKDI